MLNFITIKKDSRFEYRLYTEDSELIEGKVLYKGHKLGVSENLLSQILEYKLEKTTNKLYVFDYNSQDTWFVTTRLQPILAINKSYESLQTKAEKVLGKHRKIVITMV
jgi:hypothetical protein